MVIALEFTVSVSSSVDVLSAAVVDVLIDTLTGVSVGVTIGFLLSIGVEVLAGVNVNVCAAVMADLVELPMPTTLRIEKFSCWAAFDCWPLGALNCDRVLQAWMPSYHV